MRINSAKDDAAGQAIANRFTANIKGLTQAARNANDGISIAQTTEGALNEINNNLQRIRELSVQAANGSNSETDLESIQAEITQRLDEINRVSDQTQFNGVKVLAQKNDLTVQVGSRDAETISVNLRQINSTTLGLSTFNIEGAITGKEMTAITTGNEIETTTTVNIAANSYAVSNPGGTTLALDADDPLWASTTPGEFVVKAEDGKFYALDFNAATDKWVWDSSAGPVADASVDVNGGAVTSLPVYSTVDGTEAVDLTQLATAVTNNSSGANPTDLVLDLDTLYQLTDRTNDPAGSQSFAVKASDNNYYIVTGSATLNGGGDPADPANYTFTWGNIDVANSSNLNQVSADNVGSAVTQIQVGTFTATPEVDLHNDNLDSAPTAVNLFALADGEGYVVEDSDGNYFEADITDPTNITWDSSNTQVDASLVDAGTGKEVTELVTGTANGAISGLGTGESLHSYEDADGNTQYVVQGSNANGETTYTRADVAIDTSTGNIAVTKSTADDAAMTVDPLAMLDKALQNVDSLRSELGAIQNRFQSTIANLNNTVNNLSAARSRIEDADYAVEVSNMTRAQILQQAGTSVLAQANQVPQTVLSLLR